MKTKILLLIVAVSFAVLSCDKEDYSITETVFDPDVSTTNPEANQVTVFTDYSEGVVSRVWTFQDGIPATSTDKIVNVLFPREGPITCEIEVTYSDGFKQKKNVPIQVGDELFRRNIFSFEDSEAVMDAWQIWVAGISDELKEIEYPKYVNFSIDNTQGADGTSSCLKVNVLKPNREIQLFTKHRRTPINVVLKPNKKYILTFWIKSPTLKKLEAVEISNNEPINTAGDLLFKNIAWWSPVPVGEFGTDWEKRYVAFTTGDFSEYPTRRAENAFIQFKFKPNTAGIYFIDEISIQNDETEE